MNRHKLISAIPGMIAACCVCLLMVLAVGCEEKVKKAGPAPTPPKKKPPVVTAPKPKAAEFVNTNCPIMTKNAIDPAKVTDKLTRTHNDKKVAFCCPACPPKWDKLTDAEKDAKLAKVAAKP